MCAITGSFDTDTLKRLVQQNKERGNHSYSIAYIDPVSRSISVSKNMGVIPLDDINIPEGHYGICHTQAPTTDARSDECIHPATLYDDDNYHFLWHNGIIKPLCIDKLKQDLGLFNTKWDTELILHKLVNTGKLDGIDGSFSCMYWSNLGELFLFRNQIAPLFCDSVMNISSTKFDSSISIDPDIIWKFDFEATNMINVGEFKTVENPYFFF